MMKNEDTPGPDPEPQDEAGEKETNPETKKTAHDAFVEAARELGMTIPDDAHISASDTVAFGITPDGLEGAEQLARMVSKAFTGARMAGCPPETVALFATTLLGGFALALGHSLAGAGEIDEANPLAKVVAMNDQSNEQRAEIAKTLCEQASDHLARFAEAVGEMEAKEETRPNVDTPPLVDPTAAEELRRLFEGKGEENG